MGHSNHHRQGVRRDRSALDCGCGRVYDLGIQESQVQDAFPGRGDHPPYTGQRLRRALGSSAASAGSARHRIQFVYGGRPGARCLRPGWRRNPGRIQDSILWRGACDVVDRRSVCAVVDVRLFHKILWQGSGQDRSPQASPASPAAPPKAQSQGSPGRSTKFRMTTGDATMPYPELLIKPMREDLTRLGIREARTPEEVDAAVTGAQGTVMVVVNSVCGCAAGKARPGVALALGHSVRPQEVITVFAGA